MPILIPHFKNEINSERTYVQRNVIKSDGPVITLPGATSLEVVQKMSDFQGFMARSYKIANAAYHQFCGHTNNFKGRKSRIKAIISQLIRLKDFHVITGEKEYALLYTDMSENERDWFIYFEDSSKYVWAERTIGMLNTLVSLLMIDRIIAGCDSA